MKEFLKKREESHLELVDFLKKLRSKIINKFEEFENDKKFSKKPWDHHTGGGGEMAVLRGDVFEKAAVNWSGVWGNEFPFKDISGPFFATGVSLITHMANPHAPTVHMNIRFIDTPEKFWFGGGFDLTPMGINYDEDKESFHDSIKSFLNPICPNLYNEFSQNAKDYFYIPHRKKERGVGGIFFDNYNTGHFEKDLNLWKTVGERFLDAVIPIYQKRVPQTYSEKEKDKQLEARAHYVEFNLMYDRGTKFGFQSGGNPEAILCSLPPVVKW
jgi:coproporphyrinogen III oxidase